MVLNNTKISFKYVGKNYKCLEVKEKVHLNPKIIIKKIYKKKKVGILVSNRFKHKKFYCKINCIILNIKGTNYEIKIAKDNPMFRLNKNDIYLINYKLLKKYDISAWDKIYLKISIKII